MLCAALCLSLSFKPQCFPQIERGLCLARCHTVAQTQGIWYAFGVAWLNSRGLGCLKFDALSQWDAVFCAVCRTACKQWHTLVLMIQVSKQLNWWLQDLVFFNNVVLDCICRDQWQWKMGWIGEMALPSVTLTLKIVPQNAFVSRLMRKPSLLLPWRQTFLSNGNSRIQEFLFEVRFYFSKKGH